MSNIPTAANHGRNLHRLVMVFVLLGISSQLWASGRAPIGFRDSATVVRGGVVETLSDGNKSVLDNDYDRENDDLTAFLENKPKHGSLEFNEDGTFRYEHDGKDLKDDSFEYRAYDGRRFSRKTRVTIKIEDVANSPPYVVGEVAEQEAVVDVVYQLELAEYFLDSDDGDELQFTATGLPKSKSLKLDTNTGVLSGTPVDNDVKSTPYVVEITATDRAGASARLTFQLTIDAANSPPYVVGDVAEQEAIVDDAYRLELAGYFLDSDDGDALQFRASGLPKSKSLKLDTNTGVLSGTPIDNDVKSTPYVVEITATDRAGASARLTFQLTIRAARRPDLALAISLTANPVSVGETSQWNIEIENEGTGELDGAQLKANWATGGSSLTLASPGNCTVLDNGTAAPELSCSIGFLDAGESLMIQVDGTQSSDGDNSIIGKLIADDFVPENNVDLASSQVVAQFSEGPTQMLDVSGMGVDAGDLDGDGEIDIVTTNGQTLIFFNNGNRSVSTQGASLGPDSGGSTVTLLDWNGDESLDIAVGGLAGYTAEIFVNDGNGGFSSADSLLDGGIGNVNYMVAADLNNNGRSELVLAGSSGTIIMRSQSQGGFEQISLSSGAGLNGTVTDVDLDGDQDIIVVRQSDRAVDIHYNDGDGTSYSPTTHNYGSVATVRADDLNGDGAPDLLVGVDGDDLNTPENRIYYQQASGSFAAGGSFGASPISALLSGDVNLDGWPDVVAVNEAGVHQLYLGSAGNGFSLAPEQIVSDGMRRGVLSDFNGDGSLDLIMVGPDANVLEIHANNGIGKLGLGDRVAPSLQLVGEATINIAASAEYVDPGAIAEDDIDGEITDKIEISGTINPSAVGVQTITYSVADKAGNMSSVVRTVKVGINAGTGGGGGGITTPAFIILLTMLAALRRRMLRSSWSR